MSCLIVGGDPALEDFAVASADECAVRLVGSGEEALRLLRAGIPVDLLMTELDLPGRYDGFALARQAKALRRDLAIVYASRFLSALPEFDGAQHFGPLADLARGGPAIAGAIERSCERDDERC